MGLQEKGGMTAILFFLLSLCSPLFVVVVLFDVLHFVLLFFSLPKGGSDDYR